MRSSNSLENKTLSKSLASMYESSGSQFFRTTTGIQSGPDAFDESRFAMTFSTILGVMEILCSFRLVLQGKTSKEIPESSRLELSFWEVMDFFVLVACASLAVSRTLLQGLLACLNFTLDSEDLFGWYKRKK